MSDDSGQSSTTITDPSVNLDNVFIECNPVDTFGDEDITNVESNQIKNIFGNTPASDSDVFEDVNVSSDAVFNNIGVQALLGIGVFGIIYFIADYFFKRMPKRLLDHKIQDL